MSHSKVSIHIISFNQETYIGEAIESAISQDYPNIEVVVSDDGSTDCTGEIILKYQALYPDLIVALLNKDNVGITANSNRALKACTGKYIAFQGGDDVLLPGKISAQVSWLEESASRVLCGHQVEVFYQDNSRRPHMLSEKLQSGAGSELFILEGNFFAATSVMVRAEIIPAHGFEEELPIVSDYLMWIECLVDGGEFGYVEGVYARYRRHNGNVTNNKLKNLENHEKSLKWIMSKYPLYQAACQQALVRQVIYGKGCYYLQLENSHEAKRYFWDVIQNDPFYFKAWARLFQALFQKTVAA